MNVGARLREARESRGLSREAIARTTRIPLAALAAIEQNNITALPPYPYNKGFVEAYAREVALDPHATAREFLDQFEPPAPPPTVADYKRLAPEVLIEGGPRRLTWLVVPAIGLVLLVLVSRGSTPESSGLDRAEDPPPTETPAGPAANRDQAALPNEGSSAAAPVADARPVSVVLVTTGPAWVEAHADGRRVLYELLGSGAERRLSADREITMRIGDAGAVSLAFNNRSLGSLGVPGQVRSLRVTPDGVR
jgi:cytoskeletal protein RodZ